MTLLTLDQWAPFVLVICGAVICALFEWPFFKALLEKNNTPWADRMRAHRTVAPILLAVGSIWLLQRLWLS